MGQKIRHILGLSGGKDNKIGKRIDEFSKKTYTTEYRSVTIG